ncbi:MAG: helix-turn-helix domain-containing protein [Bacteroidota bacterium]
MTEKKEKILEAALELFAKEGYRSTSTSKVAKLAGVSEGLIFRHFGNKEGLLDAIVAEGEERAKALFADIVLETDPKEVLRKTIFMGTKMTDNPAASDFWKLQYKIKWELEQYGEHKMEPLQMALTNAFEKLDYPHPHAEALLLMMLLDGVATRYYLSKEFDLQKVLIALTRRYQI